MKVSTADVDFVLVYATQTGNAKAIAERLAELASEKNLSTHVHCISEVKVPPFFVREETAVEDGKITFDPSVRYVFISSSTGDGDPPDTAQQLVRHLKQTKKQSDSTGFDSRLHGLTYAFLCLGDTNYSTFCGGGRQLDSLLHEFGARRFLETKYADDGVGLDLVVEPWLEEVLSTIQKLKNTPSLVADNPPFSSSKSTNNDNKEVAHDSIENLIDRCQISNGNSAIEPNLELDSARFAAVYDLVLQKYPNDGKYTAAAVPPIPIDFKNWQLKQSAVPVASNGLNKVAAASTKPSGAFEKWLLTDATRLCEIDNRRYYELKLERASTVTTPQVQFKPGDAVSVAFCNSESDVSEFLSALGCHQLADHQLSLAEVGNDAEDLRIRKTPDFQTLTAYFKDASTPVTLHKSLRKLINLRAVPSISFLRFFVGVLTRKLAQLESEDLRKELTVLRSLVEHETAYRELLLEKRVGLVDFIAIFRRSSKFVLIDGGNLDANAFFSWLVYAPKHLNATPSRFFSVANGSEASRLRILFNTLQTDADYPFTTSKCGVCTHFLEQKVSSFRAAESAKREVSLKLRFRVLDTKRNEKSKVKSFLFRLPEDECGDAAPCGLVLVAIGTGLAPLIGFIEKRIAMATEAAKTDAKPPPIELLFGVRHRELAEAFCNHLLFGLRDRYAQVGGRLHIYVAISSSSSPQITREHWLDGARVQDALRNFWPCVGETLEKHNGHVYVCGDDGSRGLLQSIVDLVDELSRSDGTQWRVDVAEMQRTGRFRQDCWF